jgi:hypothetical protein
MIWASSVISSSVSPSAKYSGWGSDEKLSTGKTAITMSCVSVCKIDATKR